MPQVYIGYRYYSLLINYLFIINKGQTTVPLVLRTAKYELLLLLLSTMKSIYIILQVLALSTNTHSIQRQLRAKANRRTNRPSTSPTSTPTASQSTRRRPKTSKRTRRPVQPSTPRPSQSPSTHPSLSPSSSPSNPPTDYYWNETAKLTASDGVAYAHFGYSVSLSDNTAIVGAYDDDDYNGSAYVLEKDISTGNWNETAKLTASEGATTFGKFVSISGNIAIVSGNDQDANVIAGSAYVFEKDSVAGSWNETAILKPSDAADYDYFGESVSISGYTAIVGAYYDDDNGDRSGSAYVFEKVGVPGDWKETAKLTASDAAERDYFGYSVSISGNIAIVGAYGDDDNADRAGSAYVFERDESTGDWNETAKLIASDGTDLDYFGFRVCVSGNIAMVSAPYDDDHGSTSGSVYVFEKDDSTGSWNEVTKLTASDAAVADLFGWSVSISENIAIVGAYLNDDHGTSSGSAYVFGKDHLTGYWNETAKLTASDGAEGDYFGFTVAVSGNTAIIGADSDDDKGISSGSVYALERLVK